MKKITWNVVTLIVLVVVLLIGITIFGGDRSHPAVHAQTSGCQGTATTCLTGWAWSDNIGWVSFNSNNAGAKTATGIGEYEVDVDNAGNLSGYAWSSNVGWISFNSLVNSSDGKCPIDTGVQSGDVASNCQARVSTTTGEVYGWARAIAGCQSDMWDSVNYVCLGTGPGSDNGSAQNQVSLKSSYVPGLLAHWASVTSSSDGTKLAAAPYPGNIYTSIDSGKTWTPQAGSKSRNWIGVASSPDGNKLIAAERMGYIFTSTDGGVTWATSTGTGIANWVSIKYSGDGIHAVAYAQYDGCTSYAANSCSVYGGHVYVSSNSGASWTKMSKAFFNGSNNWGSVTSSYDGSRLALAYPSVLYTSSNSGVDWVQQTTPNLSWSSITSSLNGSKLAVVGVDNTSQLNNYVYLSSDYGVSWKRLDQVFKNGNMQIASSVDGNTLSVGGLGAYLSTTTGATWTQIVGSVYADVNIYSVALSSDGTKFVGAELNSYIYTYPTNTIVSGAGWDGWIHLSGVNNLTLDSTGKSGVTYNNTNRIFSGFAWGSDVVGWLQFSPSLLATTTCTGSDCSTAVNLVGTCSVTYKNSSNADVTVSGPTTVNLASSKGSVTYTASTTNGVGPYSYNGAASTMSAYSATLLYTPGSSNLKPNLSVQDSASPANGGDIGQYCPTVNVAGGAVDNNICKAPNHANLCNSSTDLGVSFSGKDTSSPLYDSTCSTGKFCSFQCVTGWHINSSKTACVKSGVVIEQ